MFFLGGEGGGGGGGVGVGVGLGVGVGVRGSVRDILEFLEPVTLFD